MTKNQPLLYPHLLQSLPLPTQKLWEIFGEKIRLVGGSVRDLLLNKKVSDFDFACALPCEEIIKILHQKSIKTIPTGLKYGSITALIDNFSFEITSLRTDKNQKGRDCEVEFIDDFKADAARRDFTINALYLNQKGEIFDYFQGLLDLEKKQIKFIGKPSQRITEDYLRILRFFRFSCEYSEKFDEEGLLACVEQKKNLSKLSKERIRAELLKILQSKKRERVIQTLQIIDNQGISSEIFSQNLDLKGLENFYRLEKLDNHEFDKKIILCCIAPSGSITKKEGAKKEGAKKEGAKKEGAKKERENQREKREVFIEKFWQEVCATNKEKACLKTLQKISKNFSQFLYQSSLKPEQNPALVYQGTPQCGDADISARKNYTGNPKDSGLDDFFTDLKNKKLTKNPSESVANRHFLHVFGQADQVNSDLREFGNADLRRSHNIQTMEEMFKVFLRRTATFFDNQIARNWLIYWFAKGCFTEEALNNKVLQNFFLPESQEFQASIKSLFEFVNNLQVQKLPLNGLDLLAEGIVKEEIAKNLLKASDFWSDSNFKASKTEITDFIKSNFF